MSSSFLKTSSPYSSTYGHYGAATVNPYASYFGPAPSASSPSHNVSSATSPVASPFSGSSLVVGPGGGFSMMNQATSPISSPYGYSSAFNSPVNTGRPGISGGSPSYIVPQPTQTKIIGGVNTSGFVGGSPHLGRTSATSPTAPSMYGSAFSSPLTDSGHHHEPMHYSPSGSSPPHAQNNSVYLPCYFLGLDQHQPHYSHHGGSPPTPSGGSGGNFNMSGSRGSFLSPPPKTLLKRTALFEPKSFPEGQGVDSPEVRQPVVKPKGPPIHGFGSLESASAKDFLEAVMISDSSSANIKDDQVTGSSPMLFPNMKRPQQLSPTSSTSSSPKCWVTVFGFPGGASSFIVTNFSTLGKILEVKCTPGSNWLHIRFSTPMEAHRALSKNGKVLGQSIMVGVIQSDSKVIEDAEKANISGDTVIGGTTPTCSKSPSSTLPILRERNVGSSASGDCLKSRIRPLAMGGSRLPLPKSANTAADEDATSPPKSIPGYSSIVRESFQVGRNSEGRQVPVASTGILTKAMEYMFGW